MKAMTMVALAALAGCGSGGVATSTDVKLQNATAHALSASTWELTFSVINGAHQSIERVEDVRVSTGGAPLQNASAVECAASPWTLAPGAASGVVNVDVSFGANPALAVDCFGLLDNRASTALVAPPSAPADTFELRVQGLFTDAQPFVATATAPMF